MSTHPKVSDIHKHGMEGWQDPSIAEKYFRAEAATRPFAEIILDKASIVSELTTRNAQVNAFDFGCGTGVVTAALHEAVPKEKHGNLKVLGGDISESMLEFLRKRGQKNGWPGLSTQIVDGANIQLEGEQFTHIFGNAIIFFLPIDTLPKLFSLLRPGGFIGITTWSAYGWYPFLEKTVERMSTRVVLPSLSEVKNVIHKGSPWDEAPFVKEQLEKAGFQSVEIVQKKEKIACGTPAQFCESMAMPLKMVAAYWEESKREEMLKEMTAELEKVMAEEVGEGEQCYMVMEGNVGVGWKPMEKA